MARKQPPSVIKCDTAAALQRELVPIQDTLAVDETEDTWDSIATAISRLTALSKGCSTELPREMVEGVRGLSRPLNSAINSERTRLSGVALELIASLASELHRSFDPLLPLFLPTLLTMCTRTNKVSVTRAKASLTAIIEHTGSPSVLPYLSEAAKDKSASLRLAASECALACLNCFNPPDLEKEPRAREVESVIRTAAVDANADVRKVGRKLFEAYKILLPSRVDPFVDPMTPTIKKYLDIKSKPLLQNTTSGRPPSAQGIRGKLPLSSSTPSLQPSATAPNPVRPSNHARSVSEATTVNPHAQRIRINSEQLERATATIPERSSSSTGHRATDMAPPKHVPSRPLRPTLHATQASVRSTEHQHDPRVAPMPSTSHGHGLSSSQGSQTQRPRTNTLTNSKSTSAVRPGLNVVQPQTGPIRPNSSAGVYPRLDGAEKKGRVVGGARRVPRPPPTSDATEETEKSTGHDIALSTPNPQPPYDTASNPSTRPEQDAARVQRPRIAKGNEKAVPVRSITTTTSTRPRNIPTSSTMTHAKTDRDGPQSATTNPGVVEEATKPRTRDARTKNLDASLKVTSKPTWGSSAPPKNAASSKTGLRNGKSAARGMEPPPDRKSESQPKVPDKVAVAIADSDEVAPTLIPLPPSPVPDVDADIKQTAAEDCPLSESGDPGGEDNDKMPVTPPRLMLETKWDMVGRTPISALVADIQREFLPCEWTPMPPLTSHPPLFNLSNGLKQTAGLNIARKARGGRAYEAGSGS